MACKSLLTYALDAHYYVQLLLSGRMLCPYLGQLSMLSSEDNNVYTEHVQDFKLPTP